MPRQKRFVLPGGTTPDRIDVLLARGVIQEPRASIPAAPDLEGFEISAGLNYQTEVPLHLRFFRIGSFGVVRRLVEPTPLFIETLGAMVRRVHRYTGVRRLNKDQYITIDPDNRNQLEVDLVHGNTCAELRWYEVPDFLRGLVAQLPEGDKPIAAYLGEVVVADRPRKRNRSAGTRVAFTVISPTVETEKRELNTELWERIGRPIRPRITPICTIANLPPATEAKRKALQLSLASLFITGMAPEWTEGGVPITCGRPTLYLRDKRV